MSRSSSPSSCGPHPRPLPRLRNRHRPHRRHHRRLVARRRHRLPAPRRRPRHRRLSAPDRHPPRRPRRHRPLLHLRRHPPGEGPRTPSLRRSPRQAPRRLTLPPPQSRLPSLPSLSGRFPRPLGGGGRGVGRTARNGARGAPRPWRGENNSGAQRRSGQSLLPPRRSVCLAARLQAIRLPPPRRSGVPPAGIRENGRRPTGDAAMPLDALADARLMRNFAYVGGRWTAGEANATFPVADPATASPSATSPPSPPRRPAPPPTPPPRPSPPGRRCFRRTAASSSADGSA